MSGFSEDDKMRLGAQQAALISMQEQEDRDLLDAQKEALAMRQHVMLEQEQQNRHQMILQDDDGISNEEQSQMIIVPPSSQVAQPQGSVIQELQMSQGGGPSNVMIGHVHGAPIGHPPLQPPVSAQPPAFQSPQQIIQQPPQPLAQPSSQSMQPIAPQQMVQPPGVMLPPVVGSPMGQIPPQSTQGTIMVTDSSAVIVGQPGISISTPILPSMSAPPGIPQHPVPPPSIIAPSGFQGPPGSGGQTVIPPISGPSVPPVSQPMHGHPPPLMQGATPSIMPPGGEQISLGLPGPSKPASQSQSPSASNLPQGDVSQLEQASSQESASDGSTTPKSGQQNQAQQSREIKLPQALEKMLAFKGMRAQQVGVKPEDMERVEKGEMVHEIDGTDADEIIEFYGEDEYQEDTKDAKKESKNKKRKKKKKRAKQRKLIEQQQQPIKTSTSLNEHEDVDIEYIQEQLLVDMMDPNYREFSRIFEAFKIAEPLKLPDSEGTAAPVKAEERRPEEIPIKARGVMELEELDEVVQDDKPKMSKKKQKKLTRLSVAELKQLVCRPDVVEMHDVTARDPKLLVNLKATRNTVQVPRHWCFKRKYLQGKRGFEKAPFELPEFIKATGIMEMRQALQEKEDQKTMKSKMRERVRPKMGKIDIDYQKLHDAFFKWQVKPKLTIHGDLYYEGKEFETRLKEKKPGNLTDDLRTALGMPVGSNSEKYPPPWLIAMQRYGPPPSYPNLKIPGLNAPIPEGCAFGYHAGGWGKPPVDENGKPLYGDVFGTQGVDIQAPVQEEEIDKSRWGELESESESEEESEEESDEEGDVDTSGLITPGETGLVTPSGVTSVPIGVETPDMIELRKRRIEDAMDQGGDTPALYQVLPEKKTGVGGAMMGSAHVYDISGIQAGVKKAGEGTTAEGVDIALNPDELDLDTAAMQAKYEQTVREQQSQLEKEDLSDMVAEHAAKQQKKRKKQQQEGKSAKKYREFKF